MFRVVSNSNGIALFRLTEFFEHKYSTFLSKALANVLETHKELYMCFVGMQKDIRN